MIELDTSKKYGMLTPVKSIGVNKHGNRIWECICDCGNVTRTLATYIKMGNTKSCGCLFISTRKDARRKQIFDASNKAEHGIWMGMRLRCQNPNNSGYKYYGGRGIKVCKEWDDSFPAFYRDMGKRPSSLHSIDRWPDVNGDYEPKNCRWATSDEQNRNTRHNNWIEYAGKKMILLDWATYFGVDQCTVSWHLKRRPFSEIYDFYSKKEKDKAMGIVTKKAKIRTKARIGFTKPELESIISTCSKMENDMEVSYSFMEKHLLKKFIKGYNTGLEKLKSALNELINQTGPN